MQPEAPGISASQDTAMSYFLLAIAAILGAGGVLTLLEAARIEPDNLISQIDLATVQLVSTDPAKVEQGEVLLEL